MNDVWSRWQGHLINGVFRLGRYLGCSDHSGVFLTRPAARSHSDIAIKLVPANRALAEYQLPRWKRAGGLAHPHLLRLFEWGGCQLEGSPYLYIVMEYADQTLAQLLQRRALTDGEAREMLTPVLDALGFLHGRDLVHGQLKPANVLVVGEQLKLASDTVRRTGEGRPSGHAPSVYDPPEALPGTGSPAGDIWGLGVTLCEALTRRPPPTTAARGDALMLAAEFSSDFRDLIARCLSLRPQDRPGVPALVAWAQGQSMSSAPLAGDQPTAEVPRMAPDRSAEAAQPVEVSAEAAQPVEVTVEAAQPVEVTVEAAQPVEVTVEAAQPVEVTVEAAQPVEVAAEATRPVSAMVQLSNSRTQIAIALAIVLLVALAWAGLHAFGSHPSSAGPPLAVQSPGALAAATSGATGPADPALRARGSDNWGRVQRGSNATASPSPLHQEIPEVPLGARRTIHGHIKVWVRVIVNQDGSVLAAVVDRAGPSRYFQRLALRAAKEWTFPTDATSSRRLMQIRFEFSRDGARGKAVPLN